MKQKYFYVGTEAVFHARGHKFNRLGDTIELEEKDYLDAAEGGAMFVTEAEFNIGKFTKQELAKYALHGPRSKAPADFQARFEKLQEIAANRCNSAREAKRLFEAASHQVNMAALNPSPVGTPIEPGTEEAVEDPEADKDNGGEPAKESVTNDAD